MAYTVNKTTAFLTDQVSLLTLYMPTVVVLFLFIYLFVWLNCGSECVQPVCLFVLDRA